MRPSWCCRTPSTRATFVDCCLLAPVVSLSGDAQHAGADFVYLVPNQAPDVPPIGLKLKKSPSLVDLINAQLSGAPTFVA